MTSLDPSHIPSRIHPTLGTATQPFSRRDSKPLLTVPDLRFESGYLKSISRYIVPVREVVVPVDEDGHDLDPEDNDEIDELKGVKTTTIYGINWTGLLGVMFRDQVVSPLLQGLVWGVASFYLRPLFSSLTASMRPGHPSLDGSTAEWRKGHRDGGVNKLRKWVGGLVSKQ